MTKTNDILLIRPDGSGYEMLYPDGSVQKTKEKPLAFLDRRCLLFHPQDRPEGFHPAVC